MLSKRYIDDGKSLSRLSTLQIETKKQVESKIHQGIYKFESIPCSVCNSEDFESLSQKDRFGLHVPVCICKQCGLIQTNPRMTQESYNGFYRFEYRNLYHGNQIKPNEYFKDQYRRGTRIYSLLKKNCVLPKSPFVLEVGCGMGGILQYFKQKGCKEHGIDLGQEYLNYGRKNHGLNLFAGTLANTSFQQPADIIIYSGVFEHILSLKKELSEIKSKLAPNGIVYIEVPSVKNLSEVHRMDFLRLMQNAHTYHFTLTTLRNLMETNGFEMIFGDERIISVFKKSHSTNDKPFTNDYHSVMAYLKRTETIRKILPITPNRLRQSLYKYIIKIFKPIGVYGIVKRFYWKLKGWNA